MLRRMNVVFGPRAIRNAIVLVPAFSAVASAQVDVPASVGTIPQLPDASDIVLGYFRSNMILWALGVVLGIAFPALILFSGFSARMRDFSFRIGKYWFPSLVVYLVIYLSLAWIVNAPLQWFDGFYIEHAYELSNQSFGRWLRNWVLMLAIGLVALSIGFGLFYQFIKLSPRRWWLWGGIALLPIGLFVQMIQPIYIDPLFNEYGPVSDPGLEGDIRALADRAGIGDADIYEMDASTDTESINATATGLLGTRRIVFYDTMIEKLDREAILFVMGHEIGHYVLNHRAQRVVVASLLMIFTLWSLYLVTGPVMSRFGARFGFSELRDIASVPLLFLYIQVASLVLLPTNNLFIQRTEREADRFGLEITQDTAACARVMVAGVEDRLMHPRPGPIYQLWQAGHPSAGDRYDFCVSYRPWESDDDLKYSDHFDY